MPDPAPAGPPMRQRIAAIITRHNSKWPIEIADALMSELEITVENASHISHALGQPPRRRWVTRWEWAE